MTDTTVTLRELAGKATPGPWRIRTLENFGFNIVHYNNGDKFDLTRVAKSGSEHDADYIVAANPSAIIALLDAHASQIAEKDGEIARLREALEPFAADAAQWDGTPGLVRYDDSLELWQTGQTKICVGDLRAARAAQHAAILAELRLMRGEK